MSHPLSQHDSLFFECLSLSFSLPQVALSELFHGALAGGETGGDETRASAASDFRYAQALLLSRAHASSSKPLALVPALDLLNHGGEDAGADVIFCEVSPALPTPETTPPLTPPFTPLLTTPVLLPPQPYSLPPTLYPHQTPTPPPIQDHTRV